MKTFHDQFQKNGYWILAGIAGAILFLLEFGTEIVDFTNDRWITGGVYGYDNVQHYDGWLFYRNSPWTFPIGIIKNLEIPNGVSISYTDSIPICAIFFKLLSPILPETFQYQGFFMLLSFVLQGICAALLLRNFMGAKEAFAGSLIFLLSPCLFNRIFCHTALTAHWVILLALHFSVKLFLEKAFQYQIWFTILNLTALFIHPYLFGMTFGIFLISFLIHSIETHQFRNFVIVFISQVLAAAAGACLLGLFEGGAVVPASGYGFFSSNLNSMINPKTAGDFQTWSKFFPQRTLSNEYYNEGFAYLGGGVFIGILLMVFGSVLKYKKHFTFGKYKSLLIAVLLIFILYFAFAVSNTIRWGGIILFDFPLPEKIVSLFNIFRSGGRFIWVPVYIITAFSWIVTEKAFPKASFVFFLALFLFQVIDLSPALTAYQSYAGKEPRIEDADPIWEEIAEKYEEAYTTDIHSDYLLGYWLGKNGIATNMEISTAIHIQTVEEQVNEEKSELTKSIEEGKFPSENQFCVFRKDRGYPGLIKARLFGTDYYLLLHER